MTTTRRESPRSVTQPAWKLEAPRLGAHVVAREHLVAKIEQQLGKQRGTGDVFLLSAPAGYGKTTLLAQWAAAGSVPIAWYHLDGSDDDPVVFLRGIVRALRSALPARNRARGRWGIKELLDNLYSGALSPLDLRRATEVLAADVREHISQPLALALTGIEHLSTTGGTHAILDGLLSRAPDHLRIALEAREIPTLRLSPLLPQGRLGGIGLEELQLSEDELAALLARIGVAADAGYARGLQELCTGWVMGALLATGALWPECLAIRASDQLNREAVFAYLASEVIDRLPPELSDFATRAAILSYMTAPLCARFLGMPDARKQLFALEQRTGFVTHVGRRPQEPIYRFQPLLRQVLLDRLARDVADTRIVSALHLQAGECLEEQGDLEEAVQQYAQAAAFERIVGLIERHKGALLRAGRGATLARWLDLLPDAIRAEHPVLHILLAEQRRTAGRTAEAYAVARQVCERLLPAPARCSPLAAKALLVRADLRYIQGDYEGARRDCEMARALAPDDADDLHVQAILLLAACINVLMGPDAAQSCLADAEVRCARLGDLWALARWHYVRSNLAIARGALLEAESAAASGLLFAQEANDELRAINCRLNLGGIRQFLGQIPAARADLEAALTQSEAAGHVQAQAYALVNLGDLELTSGNYTAALELYEGVGSTMASLEDQHLRVCMAMGTGYALALQGQPERAQAMLTQALAAISSAGEGIDWLLLTIALGFACHHAGDSARAETLLTRAITYARAQGIRTELVQALLALSEVYLARGSEAEACRLLRDALDIGAHIDNTPTLLLHARHHPALWPALRGLGHPLADQLLTMLAAAGRRQTGAALSPEPVPVPLQVFMLGDARVLVGGERVTRWPRPRMRELLFFLLDRGEPVRGEVIVDAIWPDKAPETADDEFRKARSELKKALGQPCLRQQDGCWQFIVPCQVDVREFERLAAEGERLAVEGRLPAACAALRDALSFWSGAYLDEIYSDWAVLRRETMHRRYLNVLERLADLELETRQYDQAARLYYQILEIESYREAAHRGLMKYFAARGEYARALTQFQTCAQVLRAHIGVAPTPQTVTLYQTIAARLRASAHTLSAARPGAS